MDLDRTRALVADHESAAIALRRRIHQHPELGHREFETTAAIADALRRVGVEPQVRETGTGLVAEIGKQGAVGGFRADLDALPIQEEADPPYVSMVPGVTHACGHDVHAALGVGIASVLAGMDDLPGRFRFLFQPAEELIPGGAEMMVAEGVADGISAFLCFHVDPSNPAGSVALMTGAITGASDRIKIELTGPGGHTSRPHQTVDLIGAAASVVHDLPTRIRRVTDPRRPVAAVFGMINGGAVENVIPTRVELGGTIRLFDLEVWRALPGLAENVVHAIVEPYGATAKVAYESGAPPVVNDPDVIEAVRSVALTALGPEAVLPTEQSLGSEDFSWFLEHAPGALVRLGARLPDRRVDLHSADFDIDESAIPTGMLVGALALGELAERAGG